MSDSWRLLDDGAREPAWNMAVDSALLEVGAGYVVRIYTWEPPGLSIGYFQEAPDRVPDGVVLVRRPTGGGAILHGGEATFSLIGPSRGVLFGAGIGPTYDVTNDIVVSALGHMGIESCSRGGERGPADDDPFLCFERKSRYDIVSDGAKVAGTAQRRERDRCLIHGSVPAAKEVGLFRDAFVAALERETGMPSVTDGLTGAEIEAARARVQRFTL